MSDFITNGELRIEAERLCDENARLREEGGRVSILDANGAMACAECGRQARAVRDRLKAENAKLRELVRDTWRELDASTQYDAGGGRGAVSEFANRARDLGIEVD